MPLHLTSGHPSYYVDIHIIELLSTAMLYRRPYELQLWSSRMIHMPCSHHTRATSCRLPICLLQLLQLSKLQLTAHSSWPSSNTSHLLTCLRENAGRDQASNALVTRSCRRKCGQKRMLLSNNYRHLGRQGDTSGKAFPAYQPQNNPQVKTSIPPWCPGLFGEMVLRAQDEDVVSFCA